MSQQFDWSTVAGEKKTQKELNHIRKKSSTSELLHQSCPIIEVSLVFKPGSVLVLLLDISDVSGLKSIFHKTFLRHFFL